MNMNHTKVVYGNREAKEEMAGQPSGRRDSSGVEVSFVARTTEILSCCRINHKQQQSQKEKSMA